MLKRIDHVFQKFLKVLCTGEFCLSVLILVAIVAINAFEIFRRQFFSLSIIWVQEITILMLTWFTFMGFCYLSYEKKDIYITFLREKLPVTMQYFVRIIVTAAVLVYLIPFTGYGWKLVVSQFHTYSSVARYPLWLKSLPAVVGGVSLILVFLNEMKEIAGEAISHFWGKEGTT